MLCLHKASSLFLVHQTITTTYIWHYITRSSNRRKEQNICDSTQAFYSMFRQSSSFQRELLNSGPRPRRPRRVIPQTACLPERPIFIRDSIRLAILCGVLLAPRTSPDLPVQSLRPAIMRSVCTPGRNVKITVNRQFIHL